MKVVAPVTARVWEAARVVNAPVEALDPPMGVLLIVPPVMVGLVIVALLKLPPLAEALFLKPTQLVAS